MCSKDKKVEESVRVPAVSGSFYPSNSAELSLEIHSLLKHASSFKCQDVNAIIVPHAGYKFSGSVAATAYNTLLNSIKTFFL
ncbi:MAG: AmmeMemoRadiSam system protein B [Campylobacterota bacterium]|nr:AmmeMemoRadiSam system protein B [Campylobacterota bacterium]